MKVFIQVGEAKSLACRGSLQQCLAVKSNTGCSTHHLCIPHAQSHPLARGLLAHGGWNHAVLDLLGFEIVAH